MSKWKTVGAVFLFCLLIGVLFYVSIVPDNVINQPFSFEDIEEGSGKVYHKVFGGKPKAIGFKRTANGKWFKNGLVYECDEVVFDGKEYECKNQKLIGKPKAEHVFKKDHRSSDAVITNVTFREDSAFGGRIHVDDDGDVYTLFSKRSGSRKDGFGLIASPKPNIFEDGTVKTPEQAKSLVGFYEIKTLDEGEGWGDMEHGEHNWTDIEVYPVILDEKHLGQDKTFYVDGIPYTTVNYGSLDDRILIRLHFKDGVGLHNWTFNPTITTTAVDANATFADTWLDNANPTSNWGASTSLYGMYRSSGPTYIALFLLELCTPTGIIGTGKTVDNLTFSAKGQQWSASPHADATFFVVSEGWNEGSNEAPGNASWYSPNNTYTNSSGGWLWTTGLGNDGCLINEVKGETLGRYNHAGEACETEPVCPWADIELTSTTAGKAAIQTMCDGTGNISFGANATNPYTSIQRLGIHSIEHATDKPFYIVEYSSNAAPVCTHDGTENKTAAEDSGSSTNDANMSESGGIHCTDEDDDALTYTELTDTGDGGGFTNANNDNILFTTDANETGTTIVTYTVSDGSETIHVSAQTTVTAVNDVPWWDYIVNETYDVDEDGGNQLVINISDYFNDVETNGTPISLGISDNETDVACSFTNDLVYCNPSNNFTGRVVVSVNADDVGSSATIYQDFEVGITAVNDKPWWDVIGNATATNVKTGGGKQPVLSNASQYWWDVEDGEDVVSNMTASTNTTSISCEVEANFSIFCTPSYYEGDFIIVLNGSDSGWNSNLESFEGYATNEPPTIPTALIPENNHLNDTLVLNLSCTGGTDSDRDTVYYDFYGDTSTTPTTNLCLNSDGGCLWTVTDHNEWLYWYCQSNDTWENSTPTTTRSIRTETWDVINLTQTYPASGEEGESAKFAINVTHNEIRYKSIIARLNTSWSPYNYNPTKTSYDNYTSFLVELDLPELSIDSTEYFNWDINLTYHNNSEFNNNTYDGSVDVKIIFVYFNCTGNATDAVAVNFSFWNEETDQEFLFAENDTQADLDAMLVMYKDNPAMNSTNLYSFDNITYLTVCIPTDKEYKCEAHIDYVLDGYSKRQHYFINNTLNNQTQNVSLYLLDSDLDDPITIHVTDEIDNAVEDAYTKIQRYYAGSDEYNTVAMAHSDDDGKDVVYLYKYVPFYRFIIEKDGSVVYTSLLIKVEADDVYLKIAPSTFSDILDTYDNIDYSMSFTGNTTFTVTASDTTGASREMCLKVVKWTQATGTNPIVCETCQTSNAVTLNCDVSSYGNGTYFANFYVSGSGRKSIATMWGEITDDVIRALQEKIGLEGVMATVFLTGTLAFIGYSISGSPAGMIVMGILGLIISSVFDFLYTSHGMKMAIISLIIIGGFLIAKLKR